MPLMKLGSPGSCPVSCALVSKLDAAPQLEMFVTSDDANLVDHADILTEYP